MSKITNAENLKKNLSKEEIIYTKDSIFDKFDIKDLVSNDLLIQKCPLKNFFYQKEFQLISNKNKNNINLSKSKQNSIDDIILEINENNNFGIKIDQLILTFPNDYKIHFIDLYTPIKLIGQGKFGLVISVLDKKTGNKIAVKIIAKNKYSEELYLIEAELLCKLNNERILKLYDVINTEKYLFIFTDLCEGGSLKDFIISRYSNTENNFFIKDSECAQIIKCILEGVEYLSQKNVIHRDLKPENIMFKKYNDLNSLVICDLGIAGELKSIYSYTDIKCGTLTFMAPEIIMSRPYDILVDIWSVGIIMYILESGGMHPILFSDINMNYTKFIEFIKKKRKWGFPKNFPLIARNLFLKLAKFEPCFRYSVTNSLNHPWITRSNKEIPLTVIEDLQKKDKIKTFKEIISSIICLKQLKKYYNFKTISNKVDTNECVKTTKRKLNINRRNIKDYGVLHSPFCENNNNCFYESHCLACYQKKLKFLSKKNLPILTRPFSKCELSNIKKSKKKDLQDKIHNSNLFHLNNKNLIYKNKNNTIINDINEYKILSSKRRQTKSKTNILQRRSLCSNESILSYSNIHKRTSANTLVKRIGKNNIKELILGRQRNENKKKLNNNSEKGNSIYMPIKINKNKENLLFNNNSTMNEIIGNINKRGNYNLKKQIGIIEAKLIFQKDRHELKSHATIKKKIFL